MIQEEITCQIALQKQKPNMVYEEIVAKGKYELGKKKKKHCRCKDDLMVDQSLEKARAKEPHNQDC